MCYLMTIMMSEKMPCKEKKLASARDMRSCQEQATLLPAASPSKPAPARSAPFLSRRSNRAHASPSAPACRALATALGCTPQLLVLRAFRATAPAELHELLRDDGVAAPDNPVRQELAPLVAAVQPLPPVTRQQLVQLWQDTLQLVQGGSGPRPQAVQACDAGAMTDARTPAA